MPRIKKLYNDYEDCSFPKKLKMKRSYDKRSNIENPDMQKLTYHEGSANMKWFYTYTEHFIQSRCGLKYDDVYSEYCQKMPYWYGDVNTRKWFNELLFDNSWHNRHWKMFYVDDEGVIKFKHKYSYPVEANKPIHVETEGSTVVYKFNKEYLTFNTARSINRFCNKFGSKFLCKIRNNEYISEEQYKNFVSKLTDQDCYPYSARSVINNAFERIIINGKMVFPGDPDYQRYWYEEKSRKRKEKRDIEKLKNNKENEYNKYLKLDKRRRRIQEYNKCFNEYLKGCS